MFISYIKTIFTVTLKIIMAFQMMVNRDLAFFRRIFLFHIVLLFASTCYVCNLK